MLEDQLAQPNVVKPIPTASAFGDWVFERNVTRSRHGLNHPERQKTMKLGAMAHDDIERFMMLSHTRPVFEHFPKQKWSIWFVDNGKSEEIFFDASRLRVGRRPMRGRPDLVLHNASDRIFLILERKTTFVPEHKIPEDGWPNLEAQLWVYSWLDQFEAARGVIQVGQIWQRIDGGLSLCSQHPMFIRGDELREKKIEGWFCDYGGFIDD